ncbi:MAG TPA: hypothetical protein VHF69_08535, partial [Candidatus Synoicihabitans sp.]|nr:hypothetical protein [Candidatus Synoicihabitans sp.]
MVERFVTAVRTEDPGLEDTAATRERLRERYPRGATRRMTQLGLVLGSTLLPFEPAEDDTLVYASGYAETRALEGYLESFPAASPTLFQTSIHPSGVRQSLIGRQQPVRTFFPLTGGAHLASQALCTALLAPSSRVLVTGGEERGTWLLEQRAASERTFAFTLALANDATAAVARVTLESGAESGAADPFSLAALFDLLVQRRNHRW